MGYHDLSESTLTDDERVAEKDRILRRILATGAFDQLTEGERNFIHKMDGAKFVSVKQLFYLRDLAEKC